MFDLKRYQYVIDFHGMERSGHSAVQTWLQELMPHSTAHVARCTEDDPIVYERKSAILTYGADVRLSTVKSLQAEPAGVVVLTRDIRNMVASRWKFHDTHYMLFGNEEMWPRWASVWKEYALMTMDQGPDIFDGHCRSIFYDRWATDQEYRQTQAEWLCEFFGWEPDHLEAAEKSRQTLAQPGYGSSFDGQDADPEKLAVTERWRVYEKDPRYIAFFKAHPHLLHLNEKLRRLA